MALDHIRILDMTQVLAGPYATMILADLGADVIKIERPSQEPRSLGPPLTGSDGAMFVALNRNKRSMAVDLRDPAGLAAIHRMVATADVFVENNRPGVTRRLGVDWETLHDINPRLVYASVSGFGQTGPYAQRPGYDLIAQGMTGIMSVTGEPGGPPIKCGLPVTDLAAGMLCASAIQAALLHRERSGEGQYVDTSLFEAGLAMSVWESTQLWATNEVPGPLGAAHRGSAPYQAVQAQDGYLIVGINNDGFWATFCELIDRPELLDDDRFVDNQARLRHREELVAEIEAALAPRTVKAWIDLFVEAGVPAGPINDYAESLQDPQALARDMVVEVDHPVEGRIPTLGVPIKMSSTPGSVRSPAPLLGEHTEECLRDVAFAEEEIQELIEQRSVFTKETIERSRAEMSAAGGNR
jgi:crotonobetainyl-CoA:carnitine CoA-transferase CaiB-like acyl-CoA transferase